MIALIHSFDWGRLGLFLASWGTISAGWYQVHHSSEERHFGKTYGDKLSIWDRMFGTVCFPQRSDRWDYGLGMDEAGDYDTVRGVYLGPLGKIWPTTWCRFGRG